MQIGLTESFDFGQGADGLPEALPKLGMFRLTSALDEACVVCQGIIARGHIVKVLPCGHPFHKDCVDGWLTKNEIDAFTATSRPPDCPTCKKSLISFIPALREYRTVGISRHWNLPKSLLLLLWILACSAVMSVYCVKFDAQEMTNWSTLSSYGIVVSATLIEPVRALLTQEPTPAA